MKAIILAAGYATRLYPLTQDKPKALLPVAGRPMLNRILEKIENIADLDGVYVVTNDRFYQHFVDWKNDLQYAKPVMIVNDNTTSNDDRLGAIGDLMLVLKQETIDDDVMVIAGDNLFEFAVQDLVSFAQQKATTTIAVHDIKHKEKAANTFGVLELDETAKVIGFEEKPAQPKTSIISTACYYFPQNKIQRIDDFLKEIPKPDNTGDLIRWLSENDTVHGWIFSDAWFDIGSHEDYDQVNKLYEK